jgi:hypothetical protein
VKRTGRLSGYFIIDLLFFIVHVYFSVRVFWQHSSEAQTRVALKRKEEDYDGDHPAAKRARLSQVEDPQETFRSLGKAPVVHIHIYH